MLSKPKMVGRFEAHDLPAGGTVYYEPEKHQYFGEIKAKPNGDYSYVAASRLVGVSTIAKYLDPNPDPLMHWAAKLDQIGIAELASQAIESGGNLTWLCSQEHIAAALREAEATWSHVRNRAAMRGTNVHERIFLALATGSEPPSLSNLSEEERGYGQAAFAWWRDNSPELIAAEQVTVSHDKRVAGRFDLLAHIDGERVLVDAKTRESGKVRQGDLVQLAGYDDLNLSCGIGGSDRQIALILMPDGTYREETGLCEATDFYAALNAYQAGKALQRRMRDAEKLVAT